MVDFWFPLEKESWAYVPRSEQQPTPCLAQFTSSPQASPLPIASLRPLHSFALPAWPLQRCETVTSGLEVRSPLPLLSTLPDLQPCHPSWVDSEGPPGLRTSPSRAAPTAGQREGPCLYQDTAVLVTGQGTASAVRLAASDTLGVSLQLQALQLPAMGTIGLVQKPQESPARRTFPWSLPHQSRRLRRDFKKGL